MYTFVSKQLPVLHDASQVTFVVESRAILIFDIGKTKSVLNAPSGVNVKKSR